jgi:hypothetical protein
LTEETLTDLEKTHSFLITEWWGASYCFVSLIITGLVLKTEPETRIWCRQFIGEGVLGVREGGKANIKQNYQG